MWHLRADLFSLWWTWGSCTWPFIHQLTVVSHRWHLQGCRSPWTCAPIQLTTAWPWAGDYVLSLGFFIYKLGIITPTCRAVLRISHDLDTELSKLSLAQRQQPLWQQGPVPSRQQNWAVISSLASTSLLRYLWPDGPPSGAWAWPYLLHPQAFLTHTWHTTWKTARMQQPVLALEKPVFW